MPDSRSKAASAQALPVSFDDLLGDDPRADLLIYSADSLLNFLAEVQDRLEKKGISQAELARRLGVKRSQLNRWLRHESGLNAKIMFQMARALGFNLELLWRELRPELRLLSGGISVNGDSNDNLAIKVSSGNWPVLV